MAASFVRRLSPQCSFAALPVGEWLRRNPRPPYTRMAAPWTDLRARLRDHRRTFNGAAMNRAILDLVVRNLAAETK